MPKAAPAEDAPREPADRSAVLAAVLAWLVPGAGHLYLGRWHRAGLFFALVSASVVLGFRLDGKLHTTFQGLLDTAATLGSLGMGPVYLVLRFVLGHTGDINAAGYEYGGAFLLTAGLMNFLLMIDCWDIAHGRKA